jgi:phthalate 4,5-dioxygenase
MAQPSVKTLRLLGQDLVLFKDASGAWGLLDRDFAHSGADLSLGRRESLEQSSSLRCPEIKSVSSPICTCGSSY